LPHILRTFCLVSSPFEALFPSFLYLQLSIRVFLLLLSILMFLLLPLRLHLLISVLVFRHLHCGFSLALYPPYRREPSGRSTLCCASPLTVVVPFFSLFTSQVSFIGKVQEQVLSQALGIQECKGLLEQRGLIVALFSAKAAAFYLEVGLGLGMTEHREAKGASRRLLQGVVCFCRYGFRVSLEYMPSTRGSSHGRDARCSLPRGTAPSRASPWD
jgi:hypothetical protein